MRRPGLFLLRAPVGLVMTLVVMATALARAADAPSAEAEAAAAPAEMTLEACLAEGLESSPLMGAARENVAVFEAKLLEASWGWFPRGKLEASFGPTPAKHGNALDGTTDFDEWGVWWKTRIEGALPVYTFGKISNLKDAAEAGVDVAEALVDLARSEIRYRVHQAWLGWQLARQTEDIVDEGRKYIERARKRLEKLEEEDAEDFDQIDLLKLRVYTADIEFLLSEARRGRALAAHGMALLLGREGQGGVVASVTPILLAETDLRPVDVDLKQLGERLAEAAGHQPALRAADAGVRARRSLADAKTAQLYPDFFVAGYFSYAQSPVIDAQDSPFAYDPWNSWFGGGAVGMRYNLEIPGEVAQRRGALAEAAMTEELARVTAAQVALEVETAYREAADLQELLPVFDKAQRAARGWVIAKSDLYDGGFGALQDVVDALAEFYKRKLGYLKAVHDFDVAVARLERATGRPITPSPGEAAP